MDASVIVAVRAALIDGLAGLPDYRFEGSTGQRPEVEFGWKVGWKRRERVWTQGATFSHEPASHRSGRTARTEFGSFELMIFVHGVGLTQREASSRALELGAAAEGWCATHDNWQGLDLGLTEFLIKGDGALAEAVDEQGNALAELRYPIQYRARLE